MRPSVNELAFVDFIITVTIVFGAIFVVSVIVSWFLSIKNEMDDD